MTATPKALYLRPFWEMRLVAKLLIVPKTVMVYWVCMMFLLFARSIETHPRARRWLLPSRGIAALPGEAVFGKGPGACEGGGVQHPKGAVDETRRASSSIEPKAHCSLAISSAAAAVSLRSRANLQRPLSNHYASSIRIFTGPSRPEEANGESLS